MFLCICICVFVQKTLGNISFISFDQELSKNVWFVWSKTSYSSSALGDVTMRDGQTDGRRTKEDRATQPLDAGRLVLQNSG